MRIIDIHIKNFQAYKEYFGNVNKDINIIQSEGHSIGKTSYINAIRWCLCLYSVYRTNGKIKHISNGVESSEVYVEITLEYKDDVYKFKRSENDNVRTFIITKNNQQYECSHEEYSIITKKLFEDKFIFLEDNLLIEDRKTGQIILHDCSVNKTILKNMNEYFQNYLKEINVYKKCFNELSIVADNVKLDLLNYSNEVYININRSLFSEGDISILYILLKYSYIKALENENNQVIVIIDNTSEFGKLDLMFKQKMINCFKNIKGQIFKTEFIHENIDYSKLDKSINYILVKEFVEE